MGEDFLSTRSVDFILQQTMKELIQEDVLIGTSLSMECGVLQPYEQQSPDEKVFGYHSSKVCALFFELFQFLPDNCTNSHFFVIQVIFDGRNPAIFENVTVYDSTIGRSANNDVNNNTASGIPVPEVFVSLLLTPIATTSSSTIPLELILEFAACPQQQSTYDCSLFAVPVVLYLANGVPIIQDAFTQEHITNWFS
jgi:hypothetical protein